MAATMKDVKERTGLSMATISKYLNGGNVLPENRVILEEAIRELNYEVNEIARGLVKNKTRTIGVLAYDISSFFSGNMLHYLGNELRKRGYGMMICDSGNDEKVEADNVKFLLSRRVDGLIVLPVSMDSSFLEPARKAGVPVVLLDRRLQDDTCDCVCIDNRMAAHRAVDVLIKNHHTKIAIIGTDTVDTGIERLKGYCDAMEQAGIEIKPEYMKMGRFSVDEGYEKMNQLLGMEDRPTAVFLSNYETALGGMMAINESEISCPQDISIFAFDDLLVSGVVRPKLWLMVQPMESLCNNAVRILLERVEGEREDEPIKLSFSAKLQEGNSILNLAQNVSL